LHDPSKVSDELPQIKRAMAASTGTGTASDNTGLEPFNIRILAVNMGDSDTLW
jgi:hypothetical protein